jgi:hypothetical protein
MTDYYPLIAKAVAGLDKNTGDQRRALYERARTALVAQLRGLDPPLTESEITRERLALEESIRKVEAEAARKARLDTPRIDPVTVARPPNLFRREDKPPPSLIPQPPTPTPPVVREPAPPAREPASPAREPAIAPRDSAPAARDPAPAPRDPPRRGFIPDPPSDAGEPRRPEAALSGAAAARAPGRNRSRPPPLTDEGLKGFRDVVAEAETLGEATAQAARSAREAYAAVPSDDPELDRMEPRMEPVGLRSPLRDAPPGRPAEPMARMPEERAPPRPAEAPRDAEPPPRPMAVRHVSVLGEEQPRRSSAALIAALFAVLVIVSIAAALFWFREPIKGWFAAVRLPLQGPTEQNPTRPKIPDRVGEPATAQKAAPGAPAGKDAQVAAVAQRVVLYEEDPADPQGKRFVGSAVWSTETVSPGPGQPPELAIRANFDIPERNMTATMSIRRNTDQALPATHTIELMFNIPADFPYGGISNVPIILMKQAEQARGAPLAGLVVKVTPTFFLVGLAASGEDAQRNIALLKERPWFDIPLVYTNGRRAILAVEKGTPGERAFNDAFAAWGQ